MYVLFVTTSDRNHMIVVKNNNNFKTLNSRWMNYVEYYLKKGMIDYTNLFIKKKKLMYFMIG